MDMKNMNLQQKIRGTIQDIKTQKKADKPRRWGEDTIIFTSWDEEIVSKLIQQEHRKKQGITDLPAYLELEEKNEEKWETIRDKLYDTTGRQYNLTVLREIAVAELLEKQDEHKVFELLRKYGQN